jgi:hypothetical protein
VAAVSAGSSAVAVDHDCNHCVALAVAVVAVVMLQAYQLLYTNLLHSIELAREWINKKQSTVCK